MSESVYGPAADPKKQKQLEKERKVAAAIREDQLRFVLGSPQGRAILWWIMGLGNPFLAPPGKPRWLEQRHIGRQEVSKEVWLRVAEQPDLYLLMLREQAPENKPEQPNRTEESTDETPDGGSEQSSAG